MVYMKGAEVIMPSVGIEWYKPYKSPADFVDKKVHSYNDISRLLANNPERIIGLTSAIESFIDNERFNTIDSKFVNDMISHQDKNFDSIVSKYVHHQIEKIATEGLSTDTDSWIIWTNIPDIKRQHNLGKVTESAAKIYNQSLHSMADVCAANMTLMDSEQVTETASKFGTEITYESMIHWDIPKVRNEVAKSDPDAAKIGDIIFNLSSNNWKELAMESFLENNETTLRAIVQRLHNPYVDIDVLEQLCVDLSTECKTSEEFLNMCVKVYNTGSYAFNPHVYQWIIQRLYTEGILTNVDSHYADEVMDIIASTIIDRMGMFVNVTEAVSTGNELISTKDLYSSSMLKPGISYPEALFYFRHLNESYNRILADNDPKAEEKIYHLKKYLDKLNWFARTEFQFNQWTDYDESAPDETQQMPVVSGIESANADDSDGENDNHSTKDGSNQGLTKTGTFSAGANQENVESKEYNERAARNAAFKSKMNMQRLKSEAKFKQQTSKVSLAYSQYKKNAQAADLKITNALKECVRTVTVGSNSKEMRREIIEGKTYSVVKLLKTFLGGYLIFATTKIGFILLLIVRACRKGKLRRSEKKKIVMELEEELVLVEEKIHDAAQDGNREAKYSLMRTKANLENAIKRIKMNTEMDKYSAGSARDIAVNDQRV